MSDDAGVGRAAAAAELVTPPPSPLEIMAASDAHAEAQREVLDELLRSSTREVNLETRLTRDLAAHAPTNIEVALRSVRCSAQLCRAEFGHSHAGAGHALHRALATSDSFRGAGFATEVPDGAGRYVTWIYSGQGDYEPASPMMADGDM